MGNWSSDKEHLTKSAFYYILMEDCDEDVDRKDIAQKFMNSNYKKIINNEKDRQWVHQILANCIITLWKSYYSHDWDTNDQFLLANEHQYTSCQLDFKIDENTTLFLGAFNKFEEWETLATIY